MKQTNQLDLQQTEYVIDQLWQPRAQKSDPVVYVILDGARNKKIFPLLNESGARFSCLYEDKLDYAMTQAAPYLVRLEKDADFTRELIQQAWGNSWGIFAIADKPTSTLIRVRRNCRKIAFVRDIAKKRKLVFRYYDPRVMRVYLPTCNTSEADKVFGPVSEFVMEGKTADQMLRFICTKQGAVNINDPELTEAQVNELMADQEKFRTLPQYNILKIREEQMSVLMHQRLEKDYQLIKQQFIDDFMDDNAFHITVNGKNINVETFSRVCFNEAMNFKLGDHYSIYRFFQISYQQGWKFWNQPENQWTKEILESTCEGNVKIEKIERSLSVSLMEQL